MVRGGWKDEMQKNRTQTNNDFVLIVNRNSYSGNDRRPECRAIMRTVEKCSKIGNKAPVSRRENIARRQLKTAQTSRVEVPVGNEYINHDYCEVAFFSR